MTIEELINKYPKIFEDYEGNPGRVNWYDLPKGWISIIDKLCGCMQSYIDNHVTYSKDGEYRPQQVTCFQMKEKFGGLRFYTNGHDNVIEGMINMAEYICDNTCQQCRSEQDLGVTSGWITVLCRTCVIEHGDRAMNAWTPLTK
jgi:hypothetical protein